MAARAATIGGESLRMIETHGPQDLAALATHVVEAGLTRAKDPRRAVSAAIGPNPSFLRGWDDRWYSIAHQLEGTIFTRRPTTLERRHGVLFATDELSLLERYLRHGRPFARGGEVHLDLLGDFFDLPYPDDRLPPDEMFNDIDDDVANEITGFLRELGAPYTLADDELLLGFLDESRHDELIHGPQGWLPSTRLDGLIGIEIRGGTIDAVALDRRDVRGPHVALAGTRMAMIAHRIIGPDPSWFGPPTMELSELLELVATEIPDVLRRPLPPLTEVLARGGLEVEDGLVGHAGTDWESHVLRAPADPAASWGYVPPETTN